MFKKEPSTKEKKINDKNSKFLLFNLNNNDKYIYVSNQKVFTKILKQENDKIHNELPVTKTSTSYQFVNNKTKQIANEIYDQNIGNQYATQKTIIIDFVEKYLKSDTTIDKKLTIFQKTKQRKVKQKQHKTTN